MINRFEKKMSIPFADVSLHNPQKYLQKITKILKTGNYILGDEVQSFEKEFATYIGARYSLGVASGTDAILLALRACDIQEGDEVIVPAFSFIASATPIAMVGAKPVFVDVREDFPVIDEKKIEQAITSKTRAIIIVHLYGYACAVDIIKEIAKKHNMYVIEDVAQAHGTIYKNRKVGSFGDIAAFSFYPTKNLGAFGDAGAVVTSNKKLFTKLQLLRDHGQKKKYKHELLGYNSRLDTIQAAVLRIKLKELDRQKRKKTNLAKKYLKLLQNLPLNTFRFPQDHDIKVALYLFVVRVTKRNELLHYLRKRGVAALIHFPTMLPDEKVFRTVKNNSYPNAKSYASSVLSLPFFAEMNTEQQEYVAKLVSDFFSEGKKKKQPE
jgi:dTDP-4-amino-4,6-dideoxygalactose transaminase